ncbi:hypothetical protein RB595_002108 [Gaeumannomyces hyphopodioides]
MPFLQTIAGKPVGSTGYGLMGFHMPPPMDFDTAASVMKAALDHGANFWNGGVHYGTPENNSLHLLRHYFSKNPADANRVVLSIKGAYDATTRSPKGSPADVRRSVDDALAVLGGAKSIDVFQCARVDPTVPIEETIGELAKLVAEGKIGGIGISEASAATIRRAAAVHPIAAVEIELSLFTTEALGNGVVDTCKKLGIPIIAYSPLGKGFLSGNIRSLDDLPKTDLRRMFPRFQPECFAQNLKLVEAVGRVAERKGSTAGQVAIAWVRQAGALPLPGSTRIEGVNENCKEISLDEGDLREIQNVVDSMPVAGDRYPPAYMKQLDV